MAVQRLLNKWKDLSRILGGLFVKPSKESDSLSLTVVRKERSSFPKLKKSVLLLSFNGQGYMGMQRNPGIPTIESELFPALVKARAIPPETVDDMGKLHYQRCSRTDKGVSAARLVISLKIRVFAMMRVTRSFHSRRYCCERSYEYIMPTYALAPRDSTSTQYRIDDTTIAAVNKLLQYYVGTHNFHNFTSRRAFEESSSKRHIVSFQVSEKFLAQGTCKTCGTVKEMEFLSLRVKGRSFMLHQIRKMIGVVIAVVRGLAPEEIIVNAFNRDKVDLPRAPGLGLLLENVHFDGYNTRFASDGSREALEWSKYEGEIEQFKREHIYQTIIDTEVNELSMMHWLCHALKIHIFSREIRLLREAAKKELLHSRTHARVDAS